MKTAQGGYKAMIRDRCPLTVDLALKWCKAKTRWVNLVYYTFVWWIKDNDARKSQVRHILGLANNYRNFEFDSTIEWDQLDENAKAYWKKVSNWVHWFERNTLVIADLYEELKITHGYDEDYIKTRICKAKFDNLPEEWQSKLYDYMLEHIKKYYV